MRILLATKIFFKALFNAEIAARVEKLLTSEAPPEIEAQAKKQEAPKAPPKKAKPMRNDAATFLAALQREARFVDFLQEPLDGFSDEQVGAVARDVHRDCRKVVERVFALAPLGDHEEGAEIELAPGFDAGQYRLTGNVTGEPPYRGRVTHHGWKTTTCQLPKWSGEPSSADVVAPIEVEM